MTRLSLILMVAIAGCSGSQANDPEEPNHDDDMAQADALGKDPSFNERETADPDSLPPTKGRPQPTQDYEVSQADCNALAGQYRRAWEADEFRKLEKQKMNDKQRAQAENNVKRESQGAHDNWLSACAGLVGSPYPRDRLDCAMKQKSVKRFDECWDGKAQEGAAAEDKGAEKGADTGE